MTDLPPDISVSIVSFNTKDLLRDCIQSLLRSQSDHEATLEIIVADNGSSDGTHEMVREEFPDVKFIETGGNIGYGRANNAALAHATGRYYLILNSDTQVQPNALQTMMAYLDHHEEAGMVGARLVLNDGSTQASCATDPTLAAEFYEQFYLDKLFPKNRLIGRYRMTHWDYETVREVDQICGANFFIRSEAFKQIGGFDPAYFMYYEDIDFCIRLRRTGWKIVFLPDAVIHHVLGASSVKRWEIRALMVASYNESRYYYYHMHYGKSKAEQLKAIVLSGALLRLLAWSIMAVLKPSARDQVKLFKDVVSRTARLPNGEKT